jgi:hypothetical protein
MELVYIIIIIIASIVFGSVILGVTFDKPIYVLFTVVVAIIVLIIFIK